MTKLYKLLITLIFFITAGIAFAQIPVNMGAIGDSMTDEYLPPDPNDSRTHTDLAAHSWLEILAQTRSDYLNFGAHKDPGPTGTGWGDRREFGYEYNFAKTGGAASRNTIILVWSAEFSIEHSSIKSAYGDTQVAGLVPYVSDPAEDIEFVYVGLGSNDFFYRTHVFDTLGNWAFRHNLDTTIPQWQTDNATEVANAILAHIDALLLADPDVKIIVGLLPPGTAGSTDPDGGDPGTLAAIELTNDLLVAGVQTRGISLAAMVDLFGFNEDPSRMDEEGNVLVGDLVVESNTQAIESADLSPTGAGPCNSSGECATLNHATKYIAEDALHPNTTIQALLANGVLLAMNEAYNAGIPLLTDDEILGVLSIPPNDLDDDGVDNSIDNCPMIHDPTNVCAPPSGC